jgi:AraC-like DNA-binding protein
VIESRNQANPVVVRSEAIGQGSQRVGAFHMLPALIRQLGSDPAATLTSAGLEPTALDDADGRVNYAALQRTLFESVRHTRCEHVGMLAGRLWHLSDLGALGELMRNSATVGEALHELTAYQHVNSESAVAFLRRAGGVVDVGCAIYESETAGVDQFGDAYLAAGFNFLRELCGPGWTPSEVFIPHTKPRDCTQYRNFFKVQPRFNAEFCALRFPEHWMDKTIEGANSERRRIAHAQVSAARRPALIQQVVRALRILLLDGKSSGDDVARMLSMHRRTLNRRLKAQGTTFQRVLDRIRFDVAIQLLGGSDISLDEVAAVLGYAGVSPFMRSFRRWTDTTPGRYRRASRQAKLSSDTLRSGRPFIGGAESVRPITVPSEACREMQRRGGRLPAPSPALLVTDGSSAGAANE